MSTVAALLSEIKIRIDQEGTTGFFSDANVISILNEGYRDLVRYTEIWEKDTNVVTTALIPIVPLPSDFLSSRQIRWSYNQQLYPRTERELDYDYQKWLFQYGTPADVVYFNWNQVRIHPNATSAGTVKFRHTYYPTTDLTSTDSPNLPEMFVDALVDYVCANAFLIMKEYENATAQWEKYISTRQELKDRARPGQMTPDTIETQRPVDAFNYPLWDSNYRIRGGSH